MINKKDLKLERADFIDAVEMADICRRSFDQEMILHKDGKPGGPKNYDDPDWHVHSMKEGVYHRIMHKSRIIGAVIIALRGKINKNGRDLYHWELVQIFIDNDYKNKGVGTFAVKQIEMWFPEMYKLTTGTPSFSAGNIRFYERLGFKKTGERYFEDEKIDIVLLEKLYSI